MSHTSRLKRSPDTFRQLTGITPEAFDRLLAELEPLYQQADTTRKTRRPRRRKPGAGRKFALPLTDRLLTLLMYYRTCATHARLGFLFGIDPSAVCRNINPLQPLLAGIFRIPERRVELQPDEIRELFFDAAVSRAFPGRTHDKRIYDATGAACPAGVPRTGDTAYLGTGQCTPTRRPPKGQLTARQEARNRRVSRRRIVAEHGIGKMKVWRIAAGRYRNPRRRHTLAIKNVAGLHTLMYARAPKTKTANRRGPNNRYCAATLVSHSGRSMIVYGTSPHGS
jgi:hypothetical protein